VSFVVPSGYQHCSNSVFLLSLSMLHTVSSIYGCKKKVITEMLLVLNLGRVLYVVCFLLV